MSWTVWPLANLEIPGSPKSQKYRGKYRCNTIFDNFFLQFLTILTIFWPLLTIFLQKNLDPGNTGVNTGILSIYPGIPVCTPVIPGMVATLHLPLASVGAASGAPPAPLHHSVAASSSMACWRCWRCWSSPVASALLLQPVGLACYGQGCSVSVDLPLAPGLLLQLSCKSAGVSLGLLPAPRCQVEGSLSFGCHLLQASPTSVNSCSSRGAAGSLDVVVGIAWWRSIVIEQNSIVVCGGSIFSYCRGRGSGGWVCDSFLS